jgi:hypothetical protein
VRDGGGALSEEQLERLARYFDEEVIAAQNYKILGLRFRTLLPDDARKVRWEPELHPL